MSQISENPIPIEEILIQKNWVREADLAQVWVDQLSQLPHVGQILFDLQLLNPTQLLDVLELQSAERISFQEALVQKNLWNEDIEKKVTQVLEASARPLLDLLIQKGLLKPESIPQILGDTHQTTPAASESKTPPNGTPVFSALDEEKIKNAQFLFSTLKAGVDDADMARPILDEIQVELRALMPILLSSASKSVQTLTTEFEQFLVQCREQVNQSQLQLVQPTSDLGEKFFGLILELKKSLSPEQELEATLAQAPYAATWELLVKIVKSFASSVKP
ncbi:MAG: hypothetical protein ACO3A2_07240 [Bdellovibrionia bacterium]